MLFTLRIICLINKTLCAGPCKATKKKKNMSIQLYFTLATYIYCYIDDFPEYKSIFFVDFG